MGARLRQARERRALGVRQASRLLKLSAASLADWESGKTKNPRIKNLLAAALLYRVSLRWLLTGQGEQDDTSVPAIDRSILETLVTVYLENMAGKAIASDSAGRQIALSIFAIHDWIARNRDILSRDPRPLTDHRRMIELLEMIRTIPADIVKVN